jgi:hypothetical protein
MVRGEVLRVGEGVEVLALPAVGTAAAGEEETAVFDAGDVGTGQAGVAFDVAAGLGFEFAGVEGLRWLTELKVK